MSADLIEGDYLLGVLDSRLGSNIELLYTYAPATTGGGAVPPAPVPLPAGAPLLLLGLGGFLAMRRKSA